MPQTFDTRTAGGVPVTIEAPNSATSSLIVAANALSGATAGLYWLNFAINSDQAAAGASWVYALAVTDILNSSTATGGRSVINGILNQTSVSNSSSANRQYVGVSGVAITTSGDGGTNLTTGARGYYFGMGSEVLIQGGTNIAGAVSAEFDVWTESGTSYANAAGISVVSGKAVSGSSMDTAINISGTGSQASPYGPDVGWGAGILFTDYNSTSTASPLQTTATLFGAHWFGTWAGTLPTVAYGIDLTQFQFSGYAFRSHSFSVDQNGNGSFGQYVYAGGNSTTGYPTGAGAAATGWNFSGGSGEVDFWNAYSAHSSSLASFIWEQQTGASSFAQLMELAGTGTLQLGSPGQGATGLVLTNATSGIVTVKPPTGALGSAALTLPAVTDTVAVLGSSGVAQTFGTGTVTFTGAVTVSATSFGLSGNISAPAWTTSGVRYKNVAATLTDTTSSGTVAAAYTDVWGGNTIAASGTVTFTNYYGSYFVAPVAGSGVTLSNSWAVGVDSLRIGTSNQLSVTAAGLLTVPGTENITGIFQISGHTMTFPNVAATLAGLNLAETFTAAQTITPTQAANTSVDGLWLNDTTAATSGNQQYSPRLHWTGRGWETSTGASQTVDWVGELQPVQLAANPGANLLFSYQINAGGYQGAITFTNAYLGVANSTGVLATAPSGGSAIFGMLTGSTEQARFQTSAGAFYVMSSNSNPMIFYNNATPAQMGEFYNDGCFAVGATGSDCGANNEYVQGKLSVGTTSTTGVFNTSGAVYLAGLSNVATTSAVCYNTSTGLLTYDGTLGTCNTSDERLKVRDAGIEDALSRLLSIHGWYFHWKDPQQYGEGERIGLMAQNVEKVFPELVATGDDGFKSLAYDKLTAPIIEALRELKVDNDNLRNEVVRLRRRVR